MTQYFARRLLQYLPVLALVSVFVFVLVRLIPGDPASVMLGPTATEEQIKLLRIDMGLEQPIWNQYVLWIQRLLGGDFGTSFINRFPVADLIWRRMPATIELAVVAIVLALAVSIPAGIIAALRQGRMADHLIVIFSSLGMGIPDFWFGILLVLLLSLRLNLLPPSGYFSIFENPLLGAKFILMPALTLALYAAAVFTRFVKSSVLEVLHQDYVRTARSKGLSQWQIIWRHVARNATIPLVTVFGIQLGGLLGGVVITESIFDWPGLGRLLVQSILKRDYSIVQAIIILTVVIYLTINLLIDLLYALIDPRIGRE